MSCLLYLKQLSANSTFLSLEISFGCVYTIKCPSYAISNPVFALFDTDFVAQKEKSTTSKYDITHRLSFACLHLVPAIMGVDSYWTLICWLWNG